MSSGDSDSALRSNPEALNTTKPLARLRAPTPRTQFVTKWCNECDCVTANKTNPPNCEAVGGIIVTVKRIVAHLVSILSPPDQKKHFRGSFQVFTCSSRIACGMSAGVYVLRTACCCFKWHGRWPLCNWIDCRSVFNPSYSIRWRHRISSFHEGCARTH
jgi:hypothetical protein